MAKPPRPLSLAAVLLLSLPVWSRGAACADPALAGGMPLADGLLQSAAAMNTYKTTIGFSDNAAFNEDCWERDGAASWKVKDPNNAAGALFDILQNPSKYSIECGTSIKFVLYMTIVQKIGSAKFNAAAAKGGPLKIGRGPYESLLGKIMKRQGLDPGDASFPGMANGMCDGGTPCVNTSKDRDEAPFISTMEPGDGVYMVNLRLPRGPDGRVVESSRGYQGQNAVYLGDKGGKKYYGHPNGHMTLTDIKAELNAYWDKGPVDSDIRGVRNGPPGFVYDIWRWDEGAINKL